MYRDKGSKNSYTKLLTINTEFWLENVVMLMRSKFSLISFEISIPMDLFIVSFGLIVVVTLSRMI